MISCFKGNFKLTSPRGDRILGGEKDFHKGIDLVGISDTTVYSISDGVVRTAYQSGGAGYYIVVTMADGRRVYYMHLKKGSFKVSSGDIVKKGQALAVMGNTGASFGAHTHLELRPAGTGSVSLDICEYTGIPNKVGVYNYNPQKEVDKVKMTKEEFEKCMMEYLDELGKKPPSEWSQKERAFCEKHGVFLGDGTGSFSYKNFVTREELAVVAYRIVNGIVNNINADITK